MLILYFLHTIFHNSEMFRSILFIIRELLNINKAYIKTYPSLNTLKFVRTMSVNIIFINILLLYIILFFIYTLI